MVSLLLTSVSSHGCSLYGYHRAELVQFLYDALHEDHRRILVGKQLTNIIHKDDGVQAICADGTTYTGSVILGADGVHSQTRTLMCELALQANAGPEWAAEKPFPATYKCLFFSTPLLSPKGHFVDTESKGRCIFYLVGQERAWVFLCETLPQPTTERAVYSADDAAEFAAKFAEFPLTNTLKVKDVYPLAQSSSMVNLEEGSAKQWSWGRVVLAGDSCHKFTPHAGQGFNCGVQDAVVLTNLLRQAIASSPEGNPTAQELKAAFESYQTLRTPYARADEVVSATIARLFSWATVFYRIMACYVFPLRLCDYLIYSRISPNGMRYAAVLDHIAAKEPFTGTVEWEHQMTGAVS